MFDTENIPQLIKTYKEKWEEFRQVLVNKELKDIDLERLKKETFLSVIDNMLKYEKDNDGNAGCHIYYDRYNQRYGRGTGE